MSGQPAPQEHPGAGIRERREALGLNREGLAYKAQVSIKTIERLEREDGLPHRATMAAIEGALAELEKAAA